VQTRGKKITPRHSSVHRLVDAARKTTRIIVTRRVCLASDDFPGRTRNHRAVHTLPGEGEGKKDRWASMSSVIKESSLLESTSGRLRWLKEGKLLRLAAISFISAPGERAGGSRGRRIHLPPSQFPPSSSFEASKAIVCPNPFSVPFLVRQSVYISCRGIQRAGGGGGVQTSREKRKAPVCI